MPKNSIHFHVLIASPSDCQEERAAIADALKRWNQVYGSLRGVELRPNLWEQDSQPELGERPQGIVNRQLVDSADILIAVFWRRLGTPTSEAISGTVEEIQRFLKRGAPALVYFSRRPTDLADLDTEQLKSLQAYKREIKEQGLTGEFATVAELREKVEVAVGVVVENLLKVKLQQGDSRLSRQELRRVQSEIDAARPLREQLYAAKSREDSDYDVVFDPRDSATFYNQIADRYDARQSDELLDAHYSAIAILERYLSGRTLPRVLDLGGGTGSEIATHFAPRNDIKWVYVDASESMAKHFKYNMRRAHMKTTVILGSAERQVESLAEDGFRFDAIIVSWLLSSVSADISFDHLRTLLKKDGCLIVADAEPSNLKNQPLYGILLGQHRVALRLRPVDPKEVQAEAISAGLELLESPPPIVKRDGTPYAYVQVYRAQSDELTSPTKRNN